MPAGRPDEHAFNEPWEIRAFAMAVAAYRNGQYEWSEFQLSLIESIRQWEQGGRDPEAERTKVVLATPRDASHQHAHREPVAVDPPRQ
jgi:nitrile hydratase accessory protein